MRYQDAAVLIERLEHNPQIEKVLVYIEVRFQQVLIEVVLGSDYDQDYHFDVTDQLDEVDAWTSFGRAVRNCTLKEFLFRRRIRGENNMNGGDLLAAVARCINAFAAEVKYNTTIESASFELPGLSMNDLSEFLENNKALKNLYLSSHEPVSLEKSAVLSRAIRIAQLKEVNISGCQFANDGLFEQILEGCSRGDLLTLTCSYNWQCTAVAALLRDPANVLSELHIMLMPPRYSEDDDWVSLVSESLVGNRKLKTLFIHARGLKASKRFEGEKLLCDVSSIEKICNSNHTIENFHIFLEHSPKLKQYLLLNRNEDKDQVIRDKVRQFYFVGKFDVSSFVNMPLSVIPKVISRIDGKDKQSAIYRLLKCIPELCNNSEHKSSNQPGKKRPKISK
jgi:hypothetical protein